LLENLKIGRMTVSFPEIVSSDLKKRNSRFDDYSESSLWPVEEEPSKPTTKGALPAKPQAIEEDDQSEKLEDRRVIAALQAMKEGSDSIKRVEMPFYLSGASLRIPKNPDERTYMN
jgi:hypothetical protein